MRKKIISTGILLLLVIGFFTKFNVDKLLPTVTPKVRFSLKKNTQSNLSPFQNLSVAQTENKTGTPSTPNPKTAFSLDEMYCQLQKLNKDFPLDGAIKISAFPIDTDGATGFTAFIQSDRCPSGLFSKIRVGAYGRIDELIDCRSTTKEELATHAGVQGNIHDLSDDPNHLNLAISGPGYFLESCRGTINYIRDGRFILSADGFVMTKDGCEVLNDEGLPLEVRDPSEIDENGCNRQNHCVAIADPDTEDVNLIHRNKLLAVTDPRKILLREKYLFKNAYEDLEDREVGPNGPDFSKMPVFTTPICRR